MGSLHLSPFTLPHAQSEDLHISHPTPGECQAIWNLNSIAWKDALSLPQYLEESAYLTTAPLAEAGGMTLWVLSDRNLLPDQRPILSSCETFRKRVLISDAKGIVSEKIVHGVASVFCNPQYRRRGYATRMMRELVKILPSWQVKSNQCVGSVLYSDIGPEFYANFGWHPFPNNNHIEIDASISPNAPRATQLVSRDLDQLCKEDEGMIRNSLSSTSSDSKLRMMIVPDHDHMLWHHKKEEFVCDKLLGKLPQVKGAIVGSPGSRIWAIWTHRYYRDPKSYSGNTLYILRLVVENQAVVSALSTKGSNLLAAISSEGSMMLLRDSEHQDLQAEQMKAILQTAQTEAAEWNLSRVELWDPTPLVQYLIGRTGIPHRKVTREHEGIASLLWFGEGSGKEDMLNWIGNEKFAWC